jgi:hypothetical protein
MIRYAGYDPDERDLEDYEIMPPADWHHQSASTPGPRPVPVDRAMQLHDAGYCWREVAQLLSWETGRNYTTDGVSGAVNRSRK